MENNPLISHSIDDNDNEPLHPSEKLRESTHIQIKLNSPLKNNDSLNSITNEREENDTDSAIKKSRKPRRSKEFIEGRNYICVLCKRAYLSRPALHNHQKTKHEFEEFKSLPISCFESNQFNFPSKKRGRPSKKYHSHLSQIANFFNAPKRRSKDIINPDEHIDKLNEFTLSNPFEEFLLYIQPLTNPSFFAFSKNIIGLFNEFEKIKNQSTDDKREIDKEHIPDLVNDYFRYVKNKDVIKEKDEKFEMVELIYVFCLWLKEKNYTTAIMEYNRNIK